MEIPENKGVCHCDDSNQFNGLTTEEYREMVTLEYILTFGYTEEVERDEFRYKELTTKHWNCRFKHEKYFIENKHLYGQE